MVKEQVHLTYHVPMCQCGPNEEQNLLNIIIDAARLVCNAYCHYCRKGASLRQYIGARKTAVNFEKISIKKNHDGQLY